MCMTFPVILMYKVFDYSYIKIIQLLRLFEDLVYQY